MVQRGQRNFPGAGTYEIGSKISEGPKYGMAAKLGSELSPMKHNPGPGTYDLQNIDNINMNRSQKYSCGSSQRLPQVQPGQKYVPGPGNYTMSLIDKQSAPKYGFGSGTRSQLEKNARLMVPGPGQYQYRNNVGREGTAPSIHQKLEYKPIEKVAGKTPGPGTYESHMRNKLAAPSYGQGSSKRDGSQKNTLETPAANAYNPSMSQTQKAGARWGFGSQKRDEMGKTTNVPGPGNYEAKSTLAVAVKGFLKYNQAKNTCPVRATTQCL